MDGIERLEIRLLTESDVPAAMKLKESAGWNQTENDWRNLLELEPHGCFGAELDGELVGTTTTTTYEDELAWIGMVLVQPERRRQGIATRLMTTALEYLKDKVATVKLDATPAGKFVYEGFGFKTEGLIERWTRGADFPHVGCTDGTILDNESFRELIALDRDAFKANRSKLIEMLVAKSSAGPIVERTEDGTLSGYALSRRGSKADYVGPVVSQDTNKVGPLLDRLLAQMTDRSLYFDFNTSCICDSAVLVERGFKKERELIRMHYGEPSAVTSPFVIAIAGPEVG
jgi:predicted GNAT family N-acyltransferase